MRVGARDMRFAMRRSEGRNEGCEIRYEEK